MQELTEWDIEQIERLCEGNKNSGMIVVTQKGLVGKVYAHEDPVNDKIVVHTEKGKLLCRAETLKLKGHFD